MRKIVSIVVFILNTSSTVLFNTTAIVGEQSIEIGDIEIGKREVFEIPRPKADSIRVIFTLSQEREDWLGTDMIPIKDIEISDSTEIFEVEVLENKK